MNHTSIYLPPSTPSLLYPPPSIDTIHQPPHHNVTIHPTLRPPSLSLSLSLTLLTVAPTSHRPSHRPSHVAHSNHHTTRHITRRQAAQEVRPHQAPPVLDARGTYPLRPRPRRPRSPMEGYRSLRRHKRYVAPRSIQTSPKSTSPLFGLSSHTNLPLLPLPPQSMFFALTLFIPSTAFVHHLPSLSFQ